MRFKLTRILKTVLYCGLFFTIIYFLSYHSSSPSLPEKKLDEDHLTANLISWEDADLAAQDAKRVGLGEQGRPVRLVGEEKTKSEKFLNQNGFNTYISDRIALDRSVADIRHPRCKKMLYSSRLPVASIVIPFFQENWNALLRTVHSSLKRAPTKLIKEVILVDDGSTREYLKSRLDDYLAKEFPDGKVRVIHSPSREGLIRARIKGALAATGDVIIFLDSHCEPNPNWLPPLLDPIAKDYRTVVCPFIDVIDADTFEYRAQDEGARGAFDWEFFYKRLPKLPQDMVYPERPFDSPVMAGGLFAISAKWFWELGGYDPGLQIWGGEQYEISFKIWMCGGRMIDVPCSRIGHIYRTHPTDFPSAGIGDFVGRNYKRVAEVWMDEYKEHLYNRRPHYRALDPGNLTEQFAIRKRLNCKSFKWFMTEIAFDLTKKYPLIDPIPAATGDVRPAVDRSMCVEALGASQTEPIKLSKCVRDGGNANGLQLFELSYHDDIRPVKLVDCLDVPGSGPRSPVILYPCHFQKGNQEWHLSPAPDGAVIVTHPKTGMCLDMDITNPTGPLFLMPTDCWDLPSRQDGASIVLYGCHGEHGNQHWAVEPLSGGKSNPVRIRQVPTNFCLEANIKSHKVVANPCNPKSETQVWFWDKLQFDAAAESRKRAGV
ncbi:hypothetical protein P879_09731 [Paragonimus westermani]|uniref:Polypeptide N-acetylgalactosaminyltransferase n=1 Tax=Paragonimus westermani TaxID=34504 RepID=A0A8T0CZS2_9TREM|nr:hypothetical protein P879_09731 [Paragonimus westermani]